VSADYAKQQTTGEQTTMHVLLGIPAVPLSSFIVFRHLGQRTLHVAR